MKLQGFDWLSDHGLSAMPEKYRPLNCFLVVLQTLTTPNTILNVSRNYFENCFQLILYTYFNRVKSVFLRYFSTDFNGT